MTVIPAEVKRMADIYRAMCKEFGIADNKPPAECVARMSTGVYQGAKGFGERSEGDVSVKKQALPSPPSLAQGAGKPPAPAGEAAKGMVPGEKPGRETLHKESRASDVRPVDPHETPKAAPSNPPTEKMIAQLRSHGYSEDAIRKLGFDEAYKIIGKWVRA